MLIGSELAKIIDVTMLVQFFLEIIKRPAEHKSLILDFNAEVTHTVSAAAISQKQ